VVPEDRISPVKKKEILVCAGFMDTYAAACDYYDTPTREGRTESPHGGIGGWKDEGIEGSRDRGTQGWKMGGWRDGGMEEWRDGRMEGWRNGGMEGWRDR
jgi:hypothetical protein